MQLLQSFTWRKRHKFGLLLGVFHWWAFHGGLWATVIIAPFFGMPGEEGVTQVLPLPLELFFIILLIYLPWKLPQWAVIPTLVGAITALEVVSGTDIWREYWKAQWTEGFFNPHRLDWTLSIQAFFMIYGPSLAILIASYLSIRQILSWIYHYQQKQRGD